MPDKDPNRAVAHNVRLLRLRLGLSQEDLAEKCGLHRTYVGAIERAERNITLSTLNRLAVALAVSPEELISSRQWERKAKNQSCLTAFVGRSRP